MDNIKNLKPTKQLDEVLKLLKTVTGKSTEVSDIAIAKGIKNSLARMILRQLHEDGYAHVNKVNGRKIEIPSFVKVQDEFYTISFKGSIFIEKGGYSRKNFWEMSNKLFKVASTILLLTGSALGITWSYIQVHKENLRLYMLSQEIIIKEVGKTIPEKVLQLNKIKKQK